MNHLTKAFSLVFLLTLISSCTGLLKKGNKIGVQSETQGEDLTCGATQTTANSLELFEYNGRSFKSSDLSLALQQSLYDIERKRYQHLKEIIESAVVDLYVQQESEKQKKSKEEVEKAFLTTVEPTENQLQDWFEKNKSRIPYPFEQVKGEIARIIKGEQNHSKRHAFIDKLQNDGSLKILAKTPESPVVDINYSGFPSMGAADPRVRIVEFADYQCGHCKTASAIIKEVVEKNKDKVQLVFMDFPLQENGLSYQHAVAAKCAEEQNKFWEYNRAVFNSPKLNDETVKQIAGELKLDMQRFETCLTSSAAKTKVDSARAEGLRLGISTTPAIYINGKKILDYNAETIQAEIDKAAASGQ